MRIGIFGGAFNPPHWGHVQLCETVLRENWVDRIWVIPCLEHPFGKELIPFEHRARMCRLGFEGLGEKVEVSEVEKELGGKSYTLRTLRHLQKQNPGETFFLLLGEDAAGEARAWQGYEELKEALGWLVVPRGPHSPVPDVSASGLRKAIAEGAPWEEDLPEKVAEYIRKNKLYV